MKRLIAVALATVFTVPVLSTLTVAAHAEDSTSSSSSTQQATPTTTSSDDSTQKAPEPAEDAKTVSNRIEQRKAELKTKLTTAEKTRLKAKCKASQGNLSSEKGRVKGLETSRGQVYNNLLTRLNDLSARLKVKGVDTTALNADIATLKTKIDTFNTDLASYKQAVSDLASMDCATDPDGFKASLEAARTALKKVNDDAAAVRSYLNDTIKPLLKTIRTELEKSQGTDDKSSTSTTPTTGSTGTTNSTTTSGSN